MSLFTFVYKTVIVIACNFKNYFEKKIYIYIYMYI